MAADDDGDEDDGDDAADADEGRGLHTEVEKEVEKEVHEKWFDTVCWYPEADPVHCRIRLARIKRAKLVVSKEFAS